MRYTNDRFHDIDNGWNQFQNVKSGTETFRRVNLRFSEVKAHAATNLKKIHNMLVKQTRYIRLTTPSL